MVSNARQLAQVPSVPSGRRNLIINGGFEVAQRGTSFTADNIYTLDRWQSSDGNGGTPARTTTQETFSLGQTDVPNATYFLKHNQTAASTNGNAALNQRIEDVTRFDDVTVTLSFYAKADAPLTVDAQFIQNFGSGGSPSSSVTVTETGISIGTSWQKYTVTKDLGSLSGKTLGSNGRHTSFLTMQIEFDDTGTFTFEIAQVQLEYGSVATDFEHRSYGEELALCQRYFYRDSQSNSGVTRHATYIIAMFQTTRGFFGMSPPVPMRIGPTVNTVGTPDLTSPNLSEDGSISSATLYGQDYNNSRFSIDCTTTTSTANTYRSIRTSQNEGFDFDAEL